MIRNAMLSGMPDAGFETVDEISIVVAPDQANADLYQPLGNEIVFNHCQKLRNRFAVLSVEQGQGQSLAKP